MNLGGDLGAPAQGRPVEAEDKGHLRCAGSFPSLTALMSALPARGWVVGCEAQGRRRPLLPVPAGRKWKGAKKGTLLYQLSLVRAMPKRQRDVRRMGAA